MRTKIAIAALAALTGLVPAAGAAGATPTTACPTADIVRPFAAFGDHRDYVLAPGGSFESTTGAGWTFTGGAKIADGNEPFQLRAPGDARSLHLVPGASATSPAMCVDLDYPTFRLPVRALDRQGATDLEIEVRYPKGADTSWKGVRTESGKSEQGWRITSDIDLKPDTHSSTMGSRMVQLRFRAKGKPGAPGWRLDNVFVDPRCH